MMPGRGTAYRPSLDHDVLLTLRIWLVRLVTLFDRSRSHFRSGQARYDTPPQDAGRPPTTTGAPELQRLTSSPDLLPDRRRRGTCLEPRVPLCPGEPKPSLPHSHRDRCASGFDHSLEGANGDSE